MRNPLPCAIATWPRTSLMRETYTCDTNIPGRQRWIGISGRPLFVPGVRVCILHAGTLLMRSLLHVRELSPIRHVRGVLQLIVGQPALLASRALLRLVLWLAAGLARHEMLHAALFDRHSLHDARLVSPMRSCVPVAERSKIMLVATDQPMTLHNSRNKLAHCVHAGRHANVQHGLKQASRGKLAAI